MSHLRTHTCNMRVHTHARVLHEMYVSHASAGTDAPLAVACAMTMQCFMTSAPLCYCATGTRSTTELGMRRMSPLAACTFA